MKRFDARGAVIAALKELGLFIETKDNAMTIPICALVHSPLLFPHRLNLCDYSKSKDIIEPVMKPQWWVDCKPLAEEAMKVCWIVRFLDWNSIYLLPCVTLPRGHAKASSKSFPSLPKPNGTPG